MDKKCVTKVTYMKNVEVKGCAEKRLYRNLQMKNVYEKCAVKKCHETVFWECVVILHTFYLC